jgi:hypothetical protein
MENHAGKIIAIMPVRLIPPDNFFTLTRNAIPCLSTALKLLFWGNTRKEHGRGLVSFVSTAGPIVIGVESA